MKIVEIGLIYLRVILHQVESKEKANTKETHKRKLVICRKDKIRRTAILS